MDPMDLSVLEGEIVAVEDAIELELEFAEFDENEMWMPEIGECIKKLEELKKELMEKLRAVKAKKPTAEQEPSKEVVRKIAEKIKELRKLMQKLNEKAKKAREVKDAAASAEKNEEKNDKIAKQKAREVTDAEASANEKDAKKGEDENDDENDDESDEKKIEEINLESDEDDEIKKVEKKTAIKRKGELEKKESPEKNKVSESENDEDESETEKEENGEASKDIVKEDVLEHDIKLLPNHDPLVYEVMIEVAAAFPLLQAQRGESVAPSLNLPQTHLKVMNEDELSEDDEEKEVIVNDAKKKKENMEERSKSDNTKIKDCVTREKFHSQEIEKLEEEVERVDETLEETLRKDEEKRDEIKRLEISIAKLDAEREDTEDDDTLGPQLDKAKKEIMKLETSTQDVLYERDNLKLAKIDAARREKEVTLKRSRKVSQKYGSKDTATKFQEKAVPLVKWLKKAEKKDIMIVKFGNDSMVSSNEDAFGNKIVEIAKYFKESNLRFAIRSKDELEDEIKQLGLEDSGADVNVGCYTVKLHKKTMLPRQFDPGIRDNIGLNESSGTLPIKYRQINIGNKEYGEFVVDSELGVPSVSVKPREGIGVYKDNASTHTPNKFCIKSRRFLNFGKLLELLETGPQFSGEQRRASVQLSGGSERGVHGRGVHVDRLKDGPQCGGHPA